MLTSAHLLRTVPELGPEVGTGSLRFSPTLPGRVDVSADGAWIIGFTDLGDGTLLADKLPG